MASITDVQLKLQAVEFALTSFTKYRNKEEERVIFLDSQVETFKFLDLYADFTKDELKDEKKQLQDALNKLQDEKNLLLAQQQSRIYLFVTVPLLNLLLFCRLSWCTCN